MLNLNDLQIFVHVVNHGGFTAASRALGLPKQTLSKRIGELERRAGLRLIQRTSRSFTVTEAGRELYRHASAMVVEAEAAEAVILGRLAEPSGTVRITASIPTAQGMLAPLLPRIAAAYPKISLVLEAGDRFVDIVQEGYDIAIRDHFGPLPDSGLVQRRVREEEFWLVAAPDFILTRVTAPSDIDGLDAVFASTAESGWTLRRGDGATAEVRLKPRYVANEGVAIRAAAEAGLGIASLPVSKIRTSLAEGRLVRVLPEWISGSITTSLLMPHRRGLLPSVRVVADLIVENFSGASAGRG
jgi:Transcriptional regulator